MSAPSSSLIDHTPFALYIYVQVLLVAAYLILATSLLEHNGFPTLSEASQQLPVPNNTTTVSSPVSSRRLSEQEWSAKKKHEEASSAVLIASQASPASGDASPAVDARGRALWTIWDKVYVLGAGAVFVFGEAVHPYVFGEGMLPFISLMAMSVFGAVGVLVCWGFSLAAILSATD